METINKAKNIIDYIAFIVTEFSEKYKLTMKEAFNYLYRYGGIVFLDKHYNYEHTENPVYTLETVRLLCQRNGGTLV